MRGARQAAEAVDAPGIRGWVSSRVRALARSPVLVTLRLLPQVSRRLSGAAVGGILVSAVLPVGLAIAGGALVEAVRAAAGEGFDSAAGQRVLVVVAILTALFVVQQLVGPALRLTADALGRRVNAALRSRAMAAALAPVGIAHLSDPVTLDRVLGAQSLGTAQVTAREAVVGLVVVGAARARKLAAALLVAAFSWWLAVVLLALYFAVATLIGRGFARRVAVLRGQPGRFRRSDYFKDLALRPAAAKELRVFGLGRWVGERFHGDWRSAMAEFERGPRDGAVGPVAALAVLVGQGGALALLAAAAARGDITVGELTAFSVGVLAVTSFRDFGIDNLNVHYGSLAVPAVLELERAVPPRTAPTATGDREAPARAAVRARGAPPPSGAAGAPARRDAAVAVRFERVSFRYQGQDRFVLRDLDLEVFAGESLAVVGPNGAGKTTLVRLLSRLYEPTSGRITVNGVDLAELDPEQWRRSIAPVFQDFIHYQLPVRDNVGLGAVEHLGDMDAVNAAARAAGAAELVGALPAGWETVLSPQFAGGTELSGGQWQRVALARALFAVGAGGARLLVLDEPAAALDVRGEAEVYDRLLGVSRGLTAILISHRLSTVRRCDRIVVLGGGRVVEQGDHDELMQARGAYAHMFRLQATGVARHHAAVRRRDRRRRREGP